MNIKSEANVNQDDSGQGSTGIGQGADGPVKWGKIRQEIATWIGELIDIRWDKGQGTAKLEDAKDENGEPKEVPCTFCFCGQHWPFNSQAYQAEDPRSHSAFAFFIHDRALLVQRKPHAGEVDEDGDGWIYEAVAVITEKKDENGEPITDPVTGIVQNEVVRRWCWPLFRNGHRSFLVNACYNYDPEQNTLVGDPFTAVQNRIYRGYPFVDIDTREPVEPFVDQQGNERPLGTVGFQGNPCLLVTKEQQVETLPDGTQTPMVDSEGEPVWCYVPHAHCEFCDPWGSFFQYVPDVTMRRRSNWKGRIVGLSEQDELLIDNIPVARITFDDSEIQASYSAAIRWVFHINDETNRLTLLRITADWQYAYRFYPEVYEDGHDVIFPRYAFATQVAIIQLDELNIYSKEIAEKPRDLLEEIRLVLDENMSWRFVAAYNSIPNIMDWALLDNIVSPYSTAKAPSLDGEIPGIDVPVSFYVAVIESDIGNSYKRKISLIVGTDGEGNCMVTKEVGDIDGTISNMSASDFSTVWNDTTEMVSIIDSVTQTIARAEEKWLEDVIIQTDSGGEENKTEVMSESREFIARVVGHEFSRRGVDGNDADVDDEMTISYLHREGDEEFEIASTRQVWKNGRATLIVIVFTGIDVENGVYSFWEWTLFDDIDLYEFGLSYISEFKDDGGWTDIRVYPKLDKKVTWRHYIVDKDTRTMTHEFEYDIPSGREDEMSDDDRDSAHSLHILFGMSRSFLLYDEESVYDEEFDRWYRESAYGARAFILPHFIDGNDNSLAACANGNIGTTGYGTREKNVRTNFIREEFSRWLGHTTMYGGLPGGTSTMKIAVDKEGDYNFSLFRGFNLHPFSDKEPGTWPYWKNAGNSLVADFHYVPLNPYWGDGSEGGEGGGGGGGGEVSVLQLMIYTGWIVGAPYLANILYTDGMERHGFALEPGLWWYSFKIKGSEENPVVVKSAEMDKMVSCTGRNDMMFTLDCYVTLQP